MVLVPPVGVGALLSASAPGDAAFLEALLSVCCIWSLRDEHAGSAHGGAGIAQTDGAPQFARLPTRRKPVSLLSSARRAGRPLAGWLVAARPTTTAPAGVAPTPFLLGKRRRDFRSSDATRGSSRSLILEG